MAGKGHSIAPAMTMMNHMSPISDWSLREVGPAIGSLNVQADISRDGWVECGQPTEAYMMVVYAFSERGKMVSYINAQTIQTQNDAAFTEQADNQADI